MHLSILSHVKSTITVPVKGEEAEGKTKWQLNFLKRPLPLLAIK